MDPARLAEIENLARWHRQRRDLYRARAHSGKPFDPGRLRDLERAHAQAEERLRAARSGA